MTAYPKDDTAGCPLTRELFRDSLRDFSAVEATLHRALAPNCGQADTCRPPCTVCPSPRSDEDGAV